MSLVAAFKGWLGETVLLVAKKIALDGDVYRDINNVTIATSDGTTQIDHILVSRYGIFVIETKNMQGWIFGSETQPRWTQSFRKSKFQFQNPLHQNYRHIKALEEFLGLPSRMFHSVVCFVGETCELKTAMPANVIRGGPFGYIKTKTAVLLPDERVLEVVQAIKTGMRPKGFLGLSTVETKREHLTSLKDRHGRTTNTQESARIYLTAQFADKELVKSLGGRWDSERKRWYVPCGISVQAFGKWLMHNDDQEHLVGSITPAPKTIFPPMKRPEINTDPEIAVEYSKQQGFTAYCKRCVGANAREDVWVAWLGVPTDPQELEALRLRLSKFYKKTRNRKTIEDFLGDALMGTWDDQLAENDAMDAIGYPCGDWSSYVNELCTDLGNFISEITHDRDGRWIGD